MGLKDKLRHLKGLPTDSDAGEHSGVASAGGSSGSSGVGGGGNGSMEMQKRSPVNEHLMPPSQLTEQTLQVWRSLPPQIRHDPSMASFQMENERIHGSAIIPPSDDESILPNELDSSPEDERSVEDTEFLKMKTLTAIKTNPDGKSASWDDNQSDNERIDTNTKAIAISSKAREKQKSKQRKEREKLWKRCGLMIFWLFAAIVLMVYEEKHLLEKTLEVPRNKTKNFLLPTKPSGDFRFKIYGAFNETNKYYEYNETDTILTIQPQISHIDKKTNMTIFTNILEPWYIPLVPEELFDFAPVLSRNLTYAMTDEILDELDTEETKMRLSISTNAEKHFTIQLIYNPLIINVKTGTMLAAMILMIFYALLVWEIFERPFVAIVCSILAIAVLACFNDRPNMEEIIKWMDMELLTLLFCMMILVAILTETGVFDYIAVVAFEISGGKIWPMIYSLCFITCLVSGFLDNMTTVLLMTPVAIRLCEVMALDPVPVLMGVIAHANIGGSLTPIGDPISIIICSNHFLSDNGITFSNFVKHTIPGVVLTTIQSCIYLRFILRDMKSLRLNEPKEIKDLRREIKVWQRAVNAISSFSKDADAVRATLMKKVKTLKHTLRRKQRGLVSADAYVHTLEELKIKYPIKDKTLLIQSCCSLVFVIVCFFIQSIPHLRTLPLGWVALLGIIALLIVLNREDMEHLMHRIEWTTLLFFAAMFVMMECVERLGLFTWIGEVSEEIILTVDKRHRLAMAIFIILWISALASAILDSIPVTVMMVKVVISLVAKESLGLPLHPLVWALAFGSSLGGNGTLYGASSNVISAGIAEQHGYKISFTRYLKISFPMMLGQITIITAYLMIAHILCEWH